MKKVLFLLLILGCSLVLQARANIVIDVETGLAIPGYNDVRIPNNDSQTRFSLQKDLGLSPTLHSRLNVHWQPSPRNRISLLATPLVLKGKGKPAHNIVFQNKTFYSIANDDFVEATYRFNSYRLQYRYVLRKEFCHIRSFGASLKLRDAEISLKSSSNFATKTNTGVVPLLGLEAGYRVNPQLDLVLEAEGLASPYGRAEDVFVGARYDLKPKLGLKGGYRFLEGGSDIDEVYTFAAVHYLVLGFTTNF